MYGPSLFRVDETVERIQEPPRSNRRRGAGGGCGFDMAGPHWKTDPGLALFGFGIILLQPDGLAAVMLVEKLL